MLLVEMTVSQSRKLSHDCRIKKRAQDTSWVICKSIIVQCSIFSLAKDIKCDNYLHMLVSNKDVSE